MDAVASVNIAWRQSLESLVFAANKLPHRKITRWRSSFSGKQCVRGHEMEIVIFPLAAMFLTSYFYYQHGGVETSILVRCVTSAHGILGILLFISAMAIGFTGSHNESNFKPLWFSLGVQAGNSCSLQTRRSAGLLCLTRRSNGAR